MDKRRNRYMRMREQRIMMMVMVMVMYAFISSREVLMRMSLSRACE